ncbi:hypothetical protein TcG_09991 [Trypanosoma cruzi]|nr:hypothetical protein TcG_09991 [Trypanosoma cruzi]
MGSKMGRGTERYCAAHVSVAFVLLRRFHSEEEGSTVLDSVAWRSYYPLFWYDVWFPPVLAPIASLSGAAPWPFFFVYRRKIPLRVTKPHGMHAAFMAINIWGEVRICG